MKKSRVIYFAFQILSTFFKDTTSMKFKRNVEGIEVGSSSKIAGGYYLQISDVPFLAFLKVDRGNGDNIYCGGSIITDTIILTAAHCLINAQSVEISVGSDDLDTATVYQSTNFMSHPSFDVKTFDYDVALIFIDDGISLDGENMKAVTLVDENTPIEVGSEIELSGFGLTEKLDYDDIIYLRGVTIPVISNDDCQVTDRQFCASTEGAKGSCVGDHGGPAVMSETQIQVGIIAYGNTCDGFTDTAVFINVADPDIQSFIRSNSNL